MKRKIEEQNEKLIEIFRQTAKQFMNNEDYESAAFWADKVVFLSKNNENDVFMQATCFYRLSEYHRASYCISSRNLHKTNLKCRHLAAKCHYAAKEFKEAFDILDCDSNESWSIAKIMDISEEDRKWKSAICLLKGKIYEALDNRDVAAQCFKEALSFNIHCYDAFQSLIQHQMMTVQEEEALIGSINFEKCSSAEERNLVHFLYNSQLKKYAKPAEFNVPDEFRKFPLDNVDVMTSLAERHYYNCDYRECLKITGKVLEKDIYHTKCLPIHLSCLMEFKKINVLFELAHKLVELYPEKALAWYAVGCYYLMINKTDAARKFLNKATTLDNVFAPAWLLYGHSFAVENEHDQAMAAYFKASHLMKGCHLPLLYIGLEYGLTDNIKLAEKFFNQAILIAPDDPFVLHELGVIAFQNQEYETAYKHFLLALDLVKSKRDTSCLPEKWESLLNNLGHVCRKLKKYEDALEYHKQALLLLPQNYSSYTAIAFVYSLMWKWDEAVDYYHKVSTRGCVCELEIDRNRDFHLESA